MLRKLLIRIALPVLVSILEETTALIIEAIKNDSLSEKNKVRYVIDGLNAKMKHINANL